jgi:hypothetical protein
MGIKKDSFYNFILLTKSNIKVVFGNKFIYFILASLAFFIFLLGVNLFSDSVLNEALCYNLMLSPALILIFYPTTFAIQNDDDTKTLEMIFGIPNYRFKIYLLRFVMIVVITFLMLIVFSLLSYVTLLSFNIWTMSLQLMFPVLFFGSLCMMVASYLKSGTSTSVVAIVVGLLLWILSSALKISQWALFLNPYAKTSMSSFRFSEILFNNRIIIMIASVTFVLTALYQLQKRERFI